MSFVDPALEHEGMSPSAGPSGKSDMNLDSHLSSMRSSAPDLQFGDDTLASAASPSQHHHDTASILHQAAAAASASDSGAHEHGHAINPHLEGMKNEEKAQPFSRSPELRVSHKLAERKRRKEMRDMFEELRVMLPVERGSKWSKWEILSKGLDWMESLKKQNEQLLLENEKLKNRVDELLNLQGAGAGGNGGGNGNANGESSSGYGFGSYGLMGTGDAGALDPNLHDAAERVEGLDEKKNTPPLDTDAIRESLTQAGVRDQDMQ